MKRVAENYQYLKKAITLYFISIVVCAFRARSGRHAMSHLYSPVRIVLRLASVAATLLASLLNFESLALAQTLAPHPHPHPHPHLQYRSPTAGPRMRARRVQPSQERPRARAPRCIRTAVPTAAPVISAACAATPRRRRPAARQPLCLRHRRISSPQVFSRSSPFFRIQRYTKRYSAVFSLPPSSTHDALSGSLRSGYPRSVLPTPSPLLSAPSRRTALTVFSPYLCISSSTRSRYSRHSFV